MESQQPYLPGFEPIPDESRTQEEYSPPKTRLGRDNPYEASEQRLRDIAKRRGEDLQYEQTGVRAVDIEVNPDDLPQVIDDPELNELWHKEQTEKATRRRGIAQSAGGLTIQQSRENAARHVAQHREKRGEERTVNRSKPAG
jgi:hypothetical protein